MELGKLGVWYFTDAMPAPDAAAFAQRIENWGYSALWIPEAVGRNALVHSSWLLANTSGLNIATGIANIYARDAYATLTAQQALAEQSGNRFLLGLGVSHQPMVEGVRGHTYAKPVATMRTYLEAMANHKYSAVAPSETPKTIIAALGPNMLALAGKAADGAHPYFVPPEHTAQAREIMGSGALLCPEQKVLLETDAGKARELARKTMTTYLGLDNYRNNLLRLGYTTDDLENGGSDKLVDAIVAWGDEDAIRKRIQEHWDAGADHVCIQPINPNGKQEPDEKLLALFAPNQA